MRTCITFFLIAAVSLCGGLAVASTPDLPSCDVWKVACHYTNSSRESTYNINRVVIHKTQGPSASGAASWFANCDSGGSAQYTFDKANGYCYQSVLEEDIAWHCGYSSTNSNSVGIEHSGWVANNDTSTACYNESAIETRSCVVYYAVPANRTYIIGHSEVPGCGTPGGGGVNCHTDPGKYWNWGYYIAQCQPTQIDNPPWWFTANKENWSVGNSIAGINWTNSAPWTGGIIYMDQTGNDAYIKSPATSFTGDFRHSVCVAVYPQNGTTSAHDMAMYWTTNADSGWDEAKSAHLNYTAGNNAWTAINIPVGRYGSEWSGQTIKQLRLDFDAVNHGNRWIVDYIVPTINPYFQFGGSVDGWTPGHSVSSLMWNGASWPEGILYCDQTGSDPYIWSPAVNHRGAANDLVDVKVYIQHSGITAHDMQLFWKTAADPTFSEAKSVTVNYTVNDNTYYGVRFPVGQNANWNRQNITQLRLDFDQANTGARWIVDYVICFQAGS